MATVPRVKLIGDTRRDIEALDSLILDAVNTLIERAGDPAVPDITDERPNADARKGVLMDCEFGLLLLTARAALQERQHLTGGALAEPNTVQTMTIALLKRALYRMSTRDQLEGGTLPGTSFFFACEPYASYQVGNARFFSANLDAAMLAVGFLAAALPQYDVALRKETCPEPLKKLKLPSLRDAALRACSEGLGYALQCRVEHDTQLMSFTCDPISKQQAQTAAGSQVPGSGGLKDIDRLFFTWSTVETINELASSTTWNNYLEGIATEPDPTRTLVVEIREQSTRLMASLTPVSEWCSRTFKDDFTTFESPDADISSVVNGFRDIGPRDAPSAKLRDDVKTIEPKVHYVYHLSQYAAIRSIVPVGVTLAEVRQLCDALDGLVSTAIIATGLDADKHERLYSVLTRTYGLGWQADRGKWDVQQYSDDAYFPLVVRALSALLTRTLTNLSKQNRQEAQALVVEFRRVLLKLTDALIQRRPAGTEHQMLWSYSPEGPYVLYATERTIFAVLAYQDFLERMDDFENTAPGLDEFQQELAAHLGQRVIEAVLRPALAEFFATHALSTAATTPAVVPCVDGDPHLPTDLLPKEPWARETLITWLSGFCKYFDDKRFQQELDIWVKKLTDLHEAQTSDQIWKPIKADMPRIAAAKRFDRDELLRILLHHVLHKYAQLACQPTDSELTTEVVELISPQDKPWSAIAGALTTNDSARRSMRQSKS